MRQPKLWQEQLPETVCVFSDVVPVYLGLASKRVVVKKQTVREANLRAKKRRQGKTVPPVTTHSMPAGKGKARDLKDRLTLLARQSLHGLFGQKGEPKLANLRGEVLSTVLIVLCNQRVRLDNITPGGFWKEREQFYQDGKKVIREKAEKVPWQLMVNWRRLRSRFPALFESGVLVW